MRERVRERIGVPSRVGGSIAQPVLPGLATMQAGVSESSSSTHH